MVVSNYLDTLEEFVFDENRVVTYKWLSQTLGIHINHAKRALYEFSLEGRKKNKRDLNITYFISGSSTLPDGTKCLRYNIVSEDQLENEKASLGEVTSCHMYSVQATKLQDTNSLYITDYELFRDNVYNYNQYGCITHSGVKLRPTDAVKAVAKPTEHAPVQEKISKGKALVKTGVESLFSKHAAKSSGTTISASSAKMVVLEKSKTDGHTGNATSKKTETVKKTDPVVKSETNKKTEAVKKTDPVVKSETNKKTETKTSSETGNKQKKQKPDSPGDSKVARRRIKNVIESSSDDDMNEPESPRPASPLREKSPEPVEEPKVMELESAEVREGEATEGRKRKRVKRLVPKTFLDDDGFMVTEKVWQTESTDASEDEEPSSKRASTGGADPVAQSAPTSKHNTGRKPPPAKKQSPVKTGAKQQPSIMSFFKKK